MLYSGDNNLDSSNYLFHASYVAKKINQLHGLIRKTCPCVPEISSFSSPQTSLQTSPLLCDDKEGCSLTLRIKIERDMEQQRHHYLIASFPAQGHINPARQLGRRLARATGAIVTLSTAVSAHRRMFPSSAENSEHHDGLITYLPYTDGYDNGFDRTAFNDYSSLSKPFGTQSLTTIAQTLASRGQPVTCVIFTILLTWAVDVAHDIGVPAVMFWPQPASVFVIYHRYFHGYAGLIVGHESEPEYTVELPGLPKLTIRDFPTFLSTHRSSFIYDMFEDMFRTLDRDLTLSKSPLRVLVNTFEELEADLFSRVDGVEMIPVGPLANDEEEGNGGVGDFFEEKSSDYMGWLDSKDKKSVVFVSFGSNLMLTWQQKKEISRGLQESGRPYLWVLRKDNREEEDKKEVGVLGEMGMVVEWCSQVRVLRHPSIGCFLTHCGWNSMFESLECGVPMVMVPKWTDQVTNAKLAEDEWGVGVRAEVAGSGEEEWVAERKELIRCLDLVMGEGEAAKEIRTRAEMWKDKAQEAAGKEGSSLRNLRTFVEMMNTS